MKAKVTKVKEWPSSMEVWWESLDGRHSGSYYITLEGIYGEYELTDMMFLTDIDIDGFYSKTGYEVDNVYEFRKKLERIYKKNIEG